MGTTLIRDEACRRGELGPAAWRMLRRAFKKEVRRFRPLLRTETIDDLALGFFADRNVSYVDAVLATSDDDAAYRLTRAWAKHWLVDKVRASPWGALRNRLEKRLQRSTLFSPSAASHHWYLTDEDDIDRGVDVEALIAAARTIRVDIVVETSGRVVLGSVGQLEDMLKHILQLAGRLHISDITRLCAHRFPTTMETGDLLTSQEPTDLLDDVEKIYEADDPIFTTAAQLADGRLARRIFDQLTERERLALAHLRRAPELSIILNVGRSTAYTLIQRAQARLIELAGDATRSEAVAGDVVALVLDEHPAVPSDTEGGAR